jgi:hypothetical protein
VLANSTPFSLAPYETRLLRPSPATLHATLVSQGSVQINFDSGTVLQAGGNLQPWVDATGTDTNLEMVPNEMRRFWRLRLP